MFEFVAKKEDFKLKFWSLVCYSYPCSFYILTSFNIRNNMLTAQIEMLELGLLLEQKLRKFLQLVAAETERL